MTLLYIITASLLVSFMSILMGIFIPQNKEKSNKYLFYLVSLAAGTFLGSSIGHLIPESFNELKNQNIDFMIPSYFILFGITTFYIIEKLIHWHHHHDSNCKHHIITSSVIIGDMLHNFIDGILIAISFKISIEAGILSTIAIIAHEIPQEIGDLSLLITNGFSKFKALLWNFISGLTSVLGAIITYIFLDIKEIIPYLSLFTAGVFIYIALADILPELNKSEKNKYYTQLIFFFLGILIIILNHLLLEHLLDLHH